MNSRITKVEGVVVEIGSNVETASSTHGVVKKYSFIVVRQDDGELVKINDAIAGPDVDAEIHIDNRAIFYVRGFRNMDRRFSRSNLIAATESRRGANFNIMPPLGSVFGTAVMTVVLSPFLFFFGYTTLGWLFVSSAGLAVGFLVACWPIVGAFVFIVGLLKVRGDAIRLKRELSARVEIEPRYDAPKMRSI